MVIDESLDTVGAVHRTWLEPAGEALVMRDDRGLERAVAGAWVIAVMRRYGRELEADIEPPAPELELGDGCALGRLDFRAAVDAGPRTYLVLHRGGEAPLAALANGVTAALRHLATRAD